MEPLTPDDLGTRLADLNGWSGDVTGISRTVEMPSFPAAIGAVDLIAILAEEADHHPDIDIRWRTLTFTLTTHAAGGRVTHRDIELAARIDLVVATMAEEASGAGPEGSSV